MIKLKQTMDSRSLDIERDGKRIGSLQWHPERTPRIVLNDSLEHISLTDALHCINQYQKLTNSRVFSV